MKINQKWVNIHAHTRKAVKSFVGSLGRQVSMTFSCVNSAIAVSSAHAPNLYMPALREYCVIRYPKNVVSSLDCAIISGSTLCSESSGSVMSIQSLYPAPA